MMGQSEPHQSPVVLVVKQWLQPLSDWGFSVAINSLHGPSIRSDDCIRIAGVFLCLNRLNIYTQRSRAYSLLWRV